MVRKSKQCKIEKCEEKYEYRCECCSKEVCGKHTFRRLDGRRSHLTNYVCEKCVNIDCGERKGKDKDKRFGW